MIKIAVLCAMLACASALQSYTCIDDAPDADGADTTIDCTAEDGADAECYGAKSPAVLNSKVGYGCGACPADTDDDTCTDCDGASASNCNTYVVPSMTWTCKNLDDGSDVDCPAAAEIHCFGPLETYTTVTGEEVLATGGCGECPGAYDDTKCVTCDTENCNSAAALVSFLAPLLALLFWLQ